MQQFTVLLFSFLLAYCSLYYELVYAQILSVCIGGTKIQYLLTISLFTSALGLGSLSFKTLRSKFPIKALFFKVELLLICLGASGPFFITWLLQSKTHQGLDIFFKNLISYTFIFLIGLLSGLELPCLFSLLKNSYGKILAFDYLGMLTASLAFPFLFLPELGTGAGTLFVSNINALALIWLMPNKVKKLSPVFYSINFSLFILIFNFRSEINQLLSHLYLGKL